MKGNWLGGDWQTPFWERTARHLGMPLDETYDDEVAEQWADSLMTDAAMRIATGVDRAYDWSGGLVSRDLRDERAAMMQDLARVMSEMK